MRSISIAYLFSTPVQMSAIKVFSHFKSFFEKNLLEIYSLVGSRPPCHESRPHCRKSRFIHNLDFQQGVFDLRQGGLDFRLVSLGFQLVGKIFVRV